MKRLSGYLLMIWLLVLVSTSPALSSTFFIYDQFGGAWHDANKTASPDDNYMCWAAAASNVLDWGNWDAGSYNTEAKIFQYFVDHWTNSAGWMSWAWKWWLTGAEPLNTLFSYPEFDGGNFFPTVNFNNYYVYAASGSMSAIDTLLHNGDGVTMTIRKGTGAHAVTVWGYGYSAPGVYTDIYMTDSDDGVTGLRSYPLVSQDGAWYLGGGYSGWRVSEIMALGYLSTPSSHTPIAPTWVLFGTGVFSLYLMRRRRPKKGESQSL